MENRLPELHYFDPRSEYQIIERRLPHWSQAGVVCFITFRTNDSMPVEVLKQWRLERNQWLRRHGINPRANDWQAQLYRLDENSRAEFYRHFSQRWHDELDAGHGACLLRNRDLAQIVADSLHKFDGDRYELTDYVIMPNHVHLLAAFPDEAWMLKQCDSWKHFTARQINLKIGNKNRFWEQDGFDHLVRSPEQFEHFRVYIARNPAKARLRKGEGLAWSKDLSCGEAERKA